MCNRSYDRDGDGTADAVFFAVLSLNGVSATGTAVPLANITWHAVAAVQDERVTALTVEVRTFADTDGWPLTTRPRTGRSPSACPHHDADTHSHSDSDCNGTETSTPTCRTRTENLSAFGITRTVENE